MQHPLRWARYRPSLHVVGMAVIALAYYFAPSCKRLLVGPKFWQRTVLCNSTLAAGPAVFLFKALAWSANYMCNRSIDI